MLLNLVRWKTRNTGGHGTRAGKGKVKTNSPPSPAAKTASCTTVREAPWQMVKPQGGHFGCT